VSHRTPQFQDRVDAGRQLAARLSQFVEERPVVLGLTRGGVPVAAEVAHALNAPLDVIVVRKLGFPGHEELAMGAIGEGTIRVLNEEIASRVSLQQIHNVEARERAELERRVLRFHADRPVVPLEGRSVIIVDDGIATGATARAALQVARAKGAKRVILAVPVAAEDTIREFSSLADQVVCLATPPHFRAVGNWYRDFAQTEDEQVCALLSAAHRSTLPSAGNGIDEEVAITLGPVVCTGHLTVPPNALGVVIFAHGSGSSRHSPRNKLVAELFHQRRLGTLLFDLLSADEAADRHNVFNIELLAARLVLATRWLSQQAEPGVPVRPFGYLGASTGGAAALWAATDPGVQRVIAAVVSRGGRPDLATPRLPHVRAPTLLIVGDHDTTVVELNRQAAEKLKCETRIELVPGATHLFEESGALEKVAELSAEWFVKHFTASAIKA